MADTRRIYESFLRQLQADEQRLRRCHEEIAQAASIGGIPAGILYNYEDAATDWEKHVQFLYGLVQKYVDPAYGTKTLGPVPLPHFTTTRSPETFTRTTVLPSTDVQVLPCPHGSGELGNPIIIALVIIAGIVITAYMYERIVLARNDTEVRVAQEYVERQKQATFAKMWDTASRAVISCMGPQPTAERVNQCWGTVVARMPALAQTIPVPQHAPPPPGTSFLGIVIGTVLFAGAIVGGVWLFRRWKAKPPGEHDAPPLEEDEDEEEVWEPSRRLPRSGRTIEMRRRTTGRRAAA